MKYAHLIWDWNGTLLDDVWLCLKSINSLLTDRDLPILTTESYKALFTFPVKDYYVQAGFNFTKEPFEVPALQFIQLYNQSKLQCTLHQNAIETLLAIQKAGIPQSLLSASEQDVLMEMLAHFGINNHFDHICGLDNHFALSKLDLGRSLITELKIAPSKILMIGDTEHDWEVAKALGTDCILYVNGHYSIRRLEKTSVRLIDDLSEIPGLIFNSLNT